MIKQLSVLLDYLNAQIGHANGNSLNELATETKEENSKMRILSVRFVSPLCSVHTHSLIICRREVQQMLRL